MLSLFKKFFAAAEGSVKGYLNPEDLYRSILTSMGSATTVGIVLTLLEAILANAGTLFPNPSVAALATALLTLVVDLLRRQSQGITSIPAPAPAPAPVPATN